MWIDDQMTVVIVMHDDYDGNDSAAPMAMARTSYSTNKMTCSSTLIIVCDRTYWIQHEQLKFKNAVIWDRHPA